MLNENLIKILICVQLDKPLAVKARDQPIFGGSQIEMKPDEKKLSW